MSYRSSQIAVQGETVQRLRLAIELYPVVCSTPTTDFYADKTDTRQLMRRITVDELADRELNRVIKEKFPKVLELEKRLNKVKADAIKEANGPA